MAIVGVPEPTGFSHMFAFSEVHVSSALGTMREGMFIPQADEGDLTAFRGSGFMGIRGPRVWVLPLAKKDSMAAS